MRGGASSDHRLMPGWPRGKGGSIMPRTRNLCSTAMQCNRAALTPISSFYGNRWVSASANQGSRTTPARHPPRRHGFTVLRRDIPACRQDQPRLGFLHPSTTRDTRARLLGRPSCCRARMDPSARPPYRPVPATYRDKLGQAQLSSAELSSSQPSPAQPSQGQPRRSRASSRKTARTPTVLCHLFKST